MKNEKQSRLLQNETAAKHIVLPGTEQSINTTHLFEYSSHSGWLQKKHTRISSTLK